MKISHASRFIFTGLSAFAAGLLLTTASAQDPAPAGTPVTPDPMPTASVAPPPTLTPAPTPVSTPTPMPVPETVTFLPAGATSPISAGVAVPAGQALLFTSGTPPSVLDDKAPEGSPERYGDTKTQGIAALRLIEAQLKKAGLGMQDVIYLRVYVAADKNKDGHFDYPGWFEAYGQFFGTAANPVKPARSTVGVASLVKPDWLIEIEAVAAYPSKGATPAPK